MSTDTALPSSARFDDAGSFLGHQPGCASDHRTVGQHRAWCFDCREWCYPQDPCVGCREAIMEAPYEDNGKTYLQPTLTPDSEALVRFWVPGQAKTQGSKRAFVNPHTGKAMMKEQIKGLGDWRADVKFFALQQMSGRQMLLEVPVFAHLYFVLSRPASVPNSKPTPFAIKNRGDIDKLTRAIYDALKGIVYSDDKLVVEQFGTKRIAELGEQPGCWVVVGQRTEKLL